MGAGGVVFDEHHLCTHFEGEGEGCGIGSFGEDTLDFGLVVAGRGGEHGYLLSIVAVGHGIVGGETDVVAAGSGAERGLHAAVEHLQVGGSEAVVADMIENLNEALVLLAEDAGELQGDVRDLRQGLATEEIGGVVVAAEHGLVAGSDHGCELLKVADHEELHSAEGEGRAAIFAQGIVDGVEEVGAHHGDLVDDEEVESADDAKLLFGE